MELEVVILIKVNQAQKAKNTMFSFICRLYTLNKCSNIIEHGSHAKGKNAHGRNKERKGNLKLECG
jgi:hypothetical protein